MAPLNSEQDFIIVLSVFDLCIYICKILGGKMVNGSNEGFRVCLHHRSIIAILRLSCNIDTSYIDRRGFSIDIFNQPLQEVVARLAWLSLH